MTERSSAPPSLAKPNVEPSEVVESDDSTKQCSRCGEVKPCGAFSPRRTKSAQQRFKAECKACGVVRATAYYKANLEQVKAKRLARHAANPEKAKAWAAAWHRANAAHRKAYSAARRAADPERFRELDKVYRQANREKAKGTMHALTHLAHKE